VCKKIYNQSNKTFIVGITKLLKPKHYTTISTEILWCGCRENGTHAGYISKTPKNRIK